MCDPAGFLTNETGAMRADQVFLWAVGLLFVGMAAYHLFTAGVGSLISTVDPGVATFADEMEIAATRYAAD